MDCFTLTKGASPESSSIIMPVYNAAPWIRDCLDSILAQSLLSEDSRETEIEVSIFDDASTDETPEILRQFADKNLKTDKFQVLVTRSDFEQPKGVGCAKNGAVNASSGDWLVFQDADDVMTNDRLSILIDHIKSVNPWTIIGSQFTRQPENSTRRYTEWANSLAKSELFTQLFTSHGPSLVAPTWCIPKKLYSTIGGFDESASVGVPEDMIFFFQAVSAGCDLHKVDRPLVIYRYHEQNASKLVKEETMWDLRLQYFVKWVLSKWSNFTIWGAGKEGRRFYRSLPDQHRAKVTGFCDVDSKKLNQGFYEYALSHAHPKPRVPIVHFKDAKPPLVICVKLGITDGALEENIESLKLREGLDYFHFG